MSVPGQARQQRDPVSIKKKKKKSTDLVKIIKRSNKTTELLRRNIRTEQQQNKAIASCFLDILNQFNYNTNNLKHFKSKSERPFSTIKNNF